MGMTQQIFIFLTLVTLTFQLGRDFCTVHLTTKFHLPMSSRSGVILRTNKQTDKQINRQTNRRCWKHPPHFATLCWWVNIYTSHPLKLFHLHCGPWKRSQLIFVRNFVNNSSAVAEMGDRLATIGMGRKWEGLLWEGAESPVGPHLTQCGLGRGLPLYQVASWSIQPFGQTVGIPRSSA